MMRREVVECGIAQKVSACIVPIHVDLGKPVIPMSIILVMIFIVLKSA